MPLDGSGTVPYGTAEGLVPEVEAEAVRAGASNWDRSFVRAFSTPATSVSGPEGHSGWASWAGVWKASPNTRIRRPPQARTTYVVWPGLWPGVISAVTPGHTSAPSTKCRDSRDIGTMNPSQDGAPTWTSPRQNGAHSAPATR